MIIATGADDAFAMPMAVSLYSALMNLRRDRRVCLYLIDGGISEENRRKVAEVLGLKQPEVRLEWIRPDLRQLSGLRACEWTTKAIYLRLFLPELLPHSCERVIYLDSDVIVQRDLGELWEEETDGFAALAGPNFNPPTVGLRVERDADYPTRGLSPESPYCNTGVLLINLKRWRAEKIGVRALEFAREFPLPDGDQDALNVIISGCWGVLNPKWNVQLSAVAHYGGFLKRVRGLSDAEAQAVCDELLADPYVLHYTYKVKPWHFIYKGPGFSQFVDYLRMSGWFGRADDNATLMRMAWDAQNKYDGWMESSYRASQHLAAAIPSGANVILIDQSAWSWGREAVASSRLLPFLEKDGEHWGPPPDDDTAIREIDRMRRSGADFIAFPFSAFWWFDQYPGMLAHLRNRFVCVVENDAVVIFDIRASSV